jgi:hypothetical protein
MQPELDNSRKAGEFAGLSVGSLVRLRLPENTARNLQINGREIPFVPCHA